MLGDSKKWMIVDDVDKLVNGWFSVYPLLDPGSIVSARALVAWNFFHASPASNVDLGRMRQMQALYKRKRVQDLGLIFILTVKNASWPLTCYQHGALRAAFFPAWPLRNAFRANLCPEGENAEEFKRGWKKNIILFVLFFASSLWKTHGVSTTLFFYYPYPRFIIDVRTQAHPCCLLQ